MSFHIKVQKGLELRKLETIPIDIGSLKDMVYDIFWKLVGEYRVLR